jgi:hypothetical protein
LNVAGISGNDCDSLCQFANQACLSGNTLSSAAAIFSVGGLRPNSMRLR